MRFSHTPCRSGSPHAVRGGAHVLAAPVGFAAPVGAWPATRGATSGNAPAGDWASWRNDVEFAPPGGERLGDVAERVASFCADVLTDDLVIAVSHVSPIKAAVCIALRVDQRSAWRMQLDVASVTRIGRRPDGGAYLVTFNDATDSAASVV